MKRVAVVALLATGCVVVPKTTRSVHTVPAGTIVTKGPLDAELSVELATVDDHVTVEIGRKRTCFRKHFVDVHTTKRKTGELKVAEPDGVPIVNPLALLFVAVAAPYVLVGSSLITGVVVATSKPEKTVEHVVEHVERFDCSVVGAAPATVELPSGATLELTSDENGNAEFHIPVNEPDVGDVRVVSGTATSTTRYFRTPAACIAARKRQLEAANVGDRGERRRRIEQLFVCRSSSERVWKYTKRALLAAIDGECEEALANGQRVSRIDRAHHDELLTRQPDMRACVVEK